MQHPAVVGISTRIIVPFCSLHSLNFYLPRRKRNKVFTSPCYQRLNGVASNFIVSVYNTVNITRCKHKSVNKENGKNEQARESRRSHKKATVSPVSPQARDSARNSLHSAYKISETKARRASVRRSFSEAHLLLDRFIAISKIRWNFGVSRVYTFEINCCTFLVKHLYLKRNKEKIDFIHNIHLQNSTKFVMIISSTKSSVTMKRISSRKKIF